MLTPVERRALTLSTFTAACISFAPAEIVSGVALLIAAGLLHRWDQRLLLQEAAAAESPATAPAPTPASPPTPAPDPTEPEAEATGRAEASEPSELVQQGRAGDGSA